VEQGPGFFGFLRNKANQAYDYITGQPHHDPHHHHEDRHIIREKYEKEEIIEPKAEEMRHSHSKETQAPTEIPHRSVLGEEFALFGFAKNELKYLKNLFLDVFYSIVGRTKEVENKAKGLAEEAKKKLREGKEYVKETVAGGKELLEEKKEQAKKKKLKKSSTMGEKMPKLLERP